MMKEHVDVRTDEDIKVDVVEQLRWDDRVDASRVQVSVVERLVTLEGAVSSNAARDAALDDASGIRGVLAVANKLQVEPRPSPVPPTDEELRDGIHRVFGLDSVLNETDVSASVEEGVVTLKGSVDAFWKMGRARELIAGFAGVREVKNQLAVVPTEDYVDQALAENLTSALERNALVDTETVTVEAENGVVTLTGTVPDWHAFRAAFHTATHTTGVVELNNRLVVYP